MRQIRPQKTISMHWISNSFIPRRGSSTRLHVQNYRRKLSRGCALVIVDKPGNTSLVSVLWGCIHPFFCWIMHWNISAVCWTAEATFRWTNPSFLAFSRDREKSKSTFRTRVANKLPTRTNLDGSLSRTINTFFYVYTRLYRMGSRRGLE